MAAEAPILESRGLTTVLGGGSGILRPRKTGTRAVDDVSLSIRRGETFGVVGESGCGKTTLGRTLLGLVRESSGEIWLEGKRVDGRDPVTARRERRAIQYLHQDAGGSLDPWWSVGRTLREAAGISGMTQELEACIDRALAAVGLDLATRALYPHQLSGGQARRVALARIMILSPKIVVLDEPTAGLDLSVQAAVLRLLVEVKQRFGLTNIFISHDMAVVQLICDRVAVMYRGRIVETAPAADLFAARRHPYTRALIDSTPRLQPRSAVGTLAPGDPPGLGQTVPGCAFHPRCVFAVDLCRTRVPELEAVTDEARIACHRWRDLRGSDQNTTAGERV